MRWNDKSKWPTVWEGGVWKGFTPEKLAEHLEDEGLTRSIADVHVFACGTGIPIRAAAEDRTRQALAVTSAMLLEEDFRVQLLNRVTGFPEVSAIYLLVSDDRSSKRIRSSELIYSYLSFAQEIRNTGLNLLLGHQNTESVVFSLVQGACVTFGAFENTRIFSLDKFIDSDEDRRAPKARIYLPALLNWIQFDQAMRIRETDPELWQAIYSPTRYSDLVISREQEPYFTQPELYKHHFKCMTARMKQLGRLTIGDRFGAITRCMSAGYPARDRRWFQTAARKTRR